jgi:hypothetical protein
MTAHEPYLCLTCNRVMVLRRCIPNGEGQPDISVWGCLHCSEKQQAGLAVIRDAPVTRTTSGRDH